MTKDMNISGGIFLTEDFRFSENTICNQTFNGWKEIEKESRDGDVKVEFYDGTPNEDGYYPEKESDKVFCETDELCDRGNPLESTDDDESPESYEPPIQESLQSCSNNSTEVSPSDGFQSPYNGDNSEASTYRDINDSENIVYRENDTFQEFPRTDNNHSPGSFYNFSYDFKDKEISSEINTISKIKLHEDNEWRELGRSGTNPETRRRQTERESVNFNGIHLDGCEHTNHNLESPSGREPFNEYLKVKLLREFSTKRVYSPFGAILPLGCSSLKYDYKFVDDSLYINRFECFGDIPENFENIESAFYFSHGYDGGYINDVNFGESKYWTQTNIGKNYSKFSFQFGDICDLVSKNAYIMLEKKWKFNVVKINSEKDYPPTLTGNSANANFCRQKIEALSDECLKLGDRINYKLNYCENVQPNNPNGCYQILPSIPLKFSTEKLCRAYHSGYANGSFSENAATLMQEIQRSESTDLHLATNSNSDLNKKSSSLLCNNTSFKMKMHTKGKQSLKSTNGKEMKTRDEKPNPSKRRDSGSSGVSEKGDFDRGDSPPPYNLVNLKYIGGSPIVYLKYLKTLCSMCTNFFGLQRAPYIRSCGDTVCKPCKDVYHCNECLNKPEGTFPNRELKSNVPLIIQSFVNQNIFNNTESVMITPLIQRNDFMVQALDELNNYLPVEDKKSTTDEELTSSSSLTKAFSYISEYFDLINDAKANADIAGQNLKKLRSTVNRVKALFTTVRNTNVTTDRTILTTFRQLEANIYVSGGIRLDDLDYNTKKMGTLSEDITILVCSEKHGKVLYSVLTVIGNMIFTRSFTPYLISYANNSIAFDYNAFQRRFSPNGVRFLFRYKDQLLQKLKFDIILVYDKNIIFSSQLKILCSGEHGPTYVEGTGKIMNNRIYIRSYVHNGKQCYGDFFNDMPDKEGQLKAPIPGTVFITRRFGRESELVISLKKEEEKQLCIGQCVKDTLPPHLDDGEIVITVTSVIWIRS